MPIQIIDNFEVNTQKPIDNRFVVGGTSSFYQTRYQIVNTYTGLRIWDLNDNLPYVYDGATWSSETSATTIQGVGTIGYLPKFNTSNSIINSQLFEHSNGTLVVGTTSAGTTGFPIGPNSYINGTKFVVDGHIRVNSGYTYYGSGSNLIQLNASNITLGSLALARISTSGSSNGMILSRDASTPIWRSPSDLTVGTASNATNLSITNETSISAHYLMFSSVTSGNTNAKVVSTSTGGIKVKPGSSQILLPTYWQNPPAPALPTSSAYGANQPPYSFSGDDNTGIYSGGSDNLSFSTGGTTRYSITNTLNTFYVPISADLSGNIIGGTLRATAHTTSPSGSISPSITFKSESTMGIYRPSSGQIGIALSGKPRFILRTGIATDFDLYSISGDPIYRAGFTNWDWDSGKNEFEIKSYSNTKLLNINGFSGAALINSSYLSFSLNQITSLSQNQSGNNSLIFSVSGSGTNNPRVNYDNNAYGHTVLSTATFEIISQQYDRILYGLNGGSNAIGSELIVQISNDGGSTWRTISRVYDRPRTATQNYWSISCIIPSGCITRLIFEGTEAGNVPGQDTVPNGTPGSFGASFTMFKFGK